MLEKIYRASPIPVQTGLLNLKAVELHVERYGRRFRRMEDLWRDNETLGHAPMRRWQDDRVRELCAHAARHVPFYRRRFAEAGLSRDAIRGVDDLQRLPLLTKDDVREHAAELVAEGAKRFALRDGNTSGTTGSPLSVRYDQQTCIAHHVVDWRQKRWGGVGMGRPYGSFQGRMIVPPEQRRPPFWRVNYLGKQHFFSAFHLAPEFLDSYVRQIETARLEFVEGYPSILCTLASHILERGWTVPLRAVFTSSETLYAPQRDLLCRAFECEVFDSLGMAERVLYAAECPAHVGKHLAQDYGVTECVDDRGNPVGDGQIGRLVGTSLHNFAFPMIRYVTNDISSVLEGECSCGRTFPRISDITTKQEAVLTLPDGRLISPSVLTHPFKPLKNVVASQIVQESIDRVTVRVVRRDAWSDEDGRVLLKGMRERLGKDMNVELEYVDDLSPEAGTKFRWVVSHVPPRFKSNVTTESVSAPSGW